MSSGSRPPVLAPPGAPAAEVTHAGAPGPLDDHQLEREPGVGTLSLVKALSRLGLAASGSEARRLIVQGGVSVDGERITAPNAALSPGAHLLKVGKRRFTRATLK